MCLHPIHHQSIHLYLKRVPNLFLHYLHRSCQAFYNTNSKTSWGENCKFALGVHSPRGERARERAGRRGGLPRARVAAFGARSRVPGESDEPRRRPPQHARHFQAASTFTCAGGQHAETQGDDRAPGVSNCVGPFLPIRFLRGDSEGARMKARVAVLALAALSHAMEHVRAELSDPSLW